MSARRPPARHEPLVSVGIPTYNRAETLSRAVQSVLAQTHRNLELVISDNASVDGTAELCRSLMERDARVRCLRASVNRGPTANFNAVFEHMRGEYVMVLSDDDWLDCNYIETCLSALRAHPGRAIACGVARYVRGSEVVKTGRQIQLTDASPARRVLFYLRQVDENGIFYGVMPAEVLRCAAPMRNVLGNDWLHVASAVARGTAVTLAETSVRRELGGTSADFRKLTRTLGLPRWQARIPHLVIAWHVFADIGWRASAYGDLSWQVRLRLAPAAALAAIRWRSLSWHVTMPAFAALSRRPRGQLLWRGFLALARLAGRSDSQADQVPVGGEPDRSR